MDATALIPKIIKFWSLLSFDVDIQQSICSI